MVIVITCCTVGRSTSPSIKAHWVSIWITTVMSSGIVRVDAVLCAVIVVVVGWAVPLVAYVQVYIGASIAAIHVCSVVWFLAGIVEVVIAVVHYLIIGAILVPRQVEQLVVVLHWKHVYSILAIKRSVFYAWPAHRSWGTCVGENQRVIDTVRAVHTDIRVSKRERIIASIWCHCSPIGAGGRAGGGGGVAVGADAEFEIIVTLVVIAGGAIPPGRIAAVTVAPVVRVVIVDPRPAVVIADQLYFPCANTFYWSL